MPSMQTPLGNHFGFDVARMRRDGFSDQDIIQHITDHTPAL